MQPLNEHNYDSITVPLDRLRAALSVAVVKAEEKPWLAGVYVHRVADTIHFAASGIDKVLVASLPGGEDMPSWLDDGVILERAGLVRSLGFLASLKVKNVTLSYQEGAARVLIADPGNECLFRIWPVEGTFPDYQFYLSGLSVFEGREIPDMASTAYAPSMLKSIGEVAKQLGAKAIRLHGSLNDGEPSLATFPDCPEVVLVLMPLQQEQRALPQPTAKLLEGPIKGTINALRAHQTRWAQKADKGTAKDKAMVEAKVAEYEERIAALLNQVQLQLPAPEPLVREEVRAELATQETAALRNKMKGAKRGIAFNGFLQDVASALFRDHGIDSDDIAELTEPASVAFSAGKTAQATAAEIAQANMQGLGLDRTLEAAE